MYITDIVYLGIPGFPPGMPYGFVRIFFFFFFFFLFFRRQGFRMITFDRQAGPLQNFNRSHIMVIGRSVLFSDPARPPGGGVGRPKHPKIPPPPRKINFCLHAFQNPRKIFEKKNLVGKKNFFAPPPPFKKKNYIFYFLGVLRPQEHFLAEIFFSVKNSTSPPPHLHTPAQSSEHSPQSSCNNK